MHPDYILNRWTSTQVPVQTNDNGNQESNSRQCCKLGERLGYQQMPCVLDLYLTSRMVNMIFAYKPKFNFGSQELIPGSDHHSFEDLVNCINHKKLFEKCCNQHYVDMKRNPLKKTLS